MVTSRQAAARLSRGRIHAFWKARILETPLQKPVPEGGGALCEAAARLPPGRIRVFWKARIPEGPPQARPWRPAAAPTGVVRGGDSELMRENSRFLEGENSGSQLQEPGGALRSGGARLTREISQRCCSCSPAPASHGAPGAPPVCAASAPSLIAVIGVRTAESKPRPEGGDSDGA
jgi:hypothetical protein